MIGNVAEYGITKMPEVDYKSHPAYANFASSRSFFVKKNALLLFLKHLELLKNFKVLARRFKRKYSISIEKPEHLLLLEKIKKNGAVAMRLDDGETKGIRLGAEKYLRIINKRIASLPKEIRLANDTRLSIPQSESRDLYNLVERVLKSRGIFAVASAYKSAPMVLQKLILQISREDDSYFKNRLADTGLSDSPTTYMHIDRTVDSKKFIKCLIYLNEVGLDNGPFSYVLGSNGLTMGFWERLIRSSHDKSGLNEWDPKTRELFFALPAFLRKKSEFGNDLPSDSEYTKALLACEYKFTSKDGNAIFFDNYGIHRGGMVEKGERIILQVHMVSKIW